MKVMWGGVGGTDVALVRLIVTEHGISYRGRPLGKRSAQSNREGYVSPGRMGEPVAGQCALRGARDVPAGERDNWSNVVNPGPYPDPKGRGNTSMVRKGR